MTDLPDACEKGTAPMNWIHLDLKGMMPGLPGMLRWMNWLADAGFDGVVIEYEDRLPWRALPGLHREVLSRDDWQTLWAHCRKRGLQIAPLMQTQGHMEWVLRHPKHAHLREDGHWNELCPSHPETQNLLRAWLDEVIDFHPDSTFIHLGADETWHLASCPNCRKRAERSPQGRLGVFLEHVGGLCRQVTARGKIPMIWADMFWRTETWSSDALPPETILVDWQYGSAGNWPSLKALKQLDRTVWGASAIRSGFDAKYALAPLGMRLENIAIWNCLRESGDVNDILHTFWARTNSLTPNYGPWEGWLPAFLAAADGRAWESHPLKALCAEVDLAMIAPEWTDLKPLIGRLEAFRHDDPLVCDCVAWWALSLKHRQLVHGTVESAIRHAAYDAVAPFRGIDPEQVAKRAESTRQWQQDLADWRAAATGWLEAHDYSDIPEYMASKTAGLDRCLALPAVSGT